MVRRRAHTHACFFFFQETKIDSTTREEFLFVNHLLRFFFSLSRLSLSTYFLSLSRHRRSAENRQQTLEMSN